MASGRRKNTRPSISAASQESDREERHRRSLRRGLVASGFGHLVLAVSLAFAPAPSARPLPAVLNVELMAGPPKPAARRPAPPAPAPAPAPAAAKPKPPPPPAPAKRVLPKDPALTKKKPRKVVKPPPKPEELDYDDALSKLRDDLGEPDQAPEAEPVVAEPETEGSSGGSGVPVPPEVLRWINQVKRHVRSTYVTPPEFLNARLETCMTVFLSSDGRLMGEPTVTRSSGNIFWDDNAVRAMVRASPLPAPPGNGGDWQVCYPSEERE